MSAIDNLLEKPAYQYMTTDVVALRDEYLVLRAQRDELAEALQKLIDDMHIRAKFRGDVDPDGTVVLDCGNGVLFAAKAALAKLEVQS